MPLQNLDLSLCELLTALPPEISELAELRLKVGPLLMALPPVIVQLSLQNLNLGCYSSLAVRDRPASGSAEDLGNCWSLTALTPEIGQLAVPQNLILECCDSFLALSPEIGWLAPLQNLD